MRLPMDLSQWGMLVVRSLVQQVPAIEPYVQMAKVQEADPEGNGYGIVPLTGGFVPFVVRNFELKPIDLLITVENGEQKFKALTEPNMVLAQGGVGMGDPVTQPVPGLQEDQALDMMGPEAEGSGFKRIQNPTSTSTVRPVKMASADYDLVELFLKEASSYGDGTLRYVVERFKDDLMQVVSSEKQANHKEPEVVIIEPLTVNGEKLANFVVDGLRAEINVGIKVAAGGLRELGLGHEIPTIARGELVIYDKRPVEKKAGLWNHETGRPHDCPASVVIKEPGWYSKGGQKYRFFRTMYLDGKPCSYMLGVSPAGFCFNRMEMGFAADAVPSTELANYYRLSSLHLGDTCFVMNEKTGEASVPFVVRGSTALPNGGYKLIAEPLMGESPTVTLTFGDNNHPYAIGPAEVAFPKFGWTVFSIKGKKTEPTITEGEPWGKPICVTIVKGGGVFEIREGKHPAFTGLTRGQVVYQLMTRYRMSSDQALAYIQQIATYTATPLKVVPVEQPVNAAVDISLQQQAATKYACLLWDFVKKAAEATKKKTEKVNPNKEPGRENVDLDSDKSGPNREVEDEGPESGPPEAADGTDMAADMPTEGGAGAPAGQQPGAAGMPPGQAQANFGGPGGLAAMDPNGAAIMPDIPFMQDVADTITGYAMGIFTPDELGQIYTQLIDKLADVEDLAGRVLLLVRLGKVDIITENEAKRLLDESDKFRSALLNADMLLKGVASAA